MNSAQLKTYVDGTAQVGTQWTTTKSYCPNDTDKDVRNLISRTRKIVSADNSLTLYDEEGQKLLVASNFI